MTCTDRAVKLGETSDEAEAIKLIQAWWDEVTEGVTTAPQYPPFTKAKLATVMWDKQEPGQDRMCLAWIVDLD